MSSCEHSVKEIIITSENIGWTLLLLFSLNEPDVNACDERYCISEQRGGVLVSLTVLLLHIWMYISGVYFGQIGRFVEINGWVYDALVPPYHWHRSNLCRCEQLTSYSSPFDSRESRVIQGSDLFTAYQPVTVKSAANPTDPAIHQHAMC